MRKYISNNLLEQQAIKSKLFEHDLEIKALKDTFQCFEEKRKISEIYFNGQIYDVYSKILDIFYSAKKELIIIDMLIKHFLI